MEKEYGRKQAHKVFAGATECELAGLLLSPYVLVCVYDSSSLSFTDRSF